jgi:hypothetical protein
VHSLPKLDESKCPKKAIFFRFLSLSFTIMILFGLVICRVFHSYRHFGRFTTLDILEYQAVSAIAVDGRIRRIAAKLCANAGLSRGLGLPSPTTSSGFGEPFGRFGHRRAADVNIRDKARN